MMILHKIYAYLKQGGKHDKFGNFYAEPTPLHEKAFRHPDQRNCDVDTWFYNEKKDNKLALNKKLFKLYIALNII